MSKSCLNLSVAVALAALLQATPVHAQTCTDPSAGPFGAQLDPAEFNTGVKALPPAALLVQQIQPALPSRVVLANLPAVAQQGTAANPGSPGSCEAQAFGYGLGSYTAARSSFGELKWNPALPGRSVSAAYLYERQLGNQHEVCGKGTTALNYLAQLVRLGAPARSVVPYYADCTYLETIPGQADFPDDYPGMAPFRIGSYANFSVSRNPAAAVQLIKQLIANGQAVAFSGLVLCGYGRHVPLRLKDGVVYETSYIVGANNKPAGHAQMVVGYDDNAGVPGDKGALLIQNSFGTAWPPASAGHSPAPPGMVYWSYKSFEKTQKLAAVAYPRASGGAGGVWLSRSPNAPPAWITRAFQWAPAGKPQATYLILTHFFQEPILLESVTLTEPGAKAVTATAAYGQYISTGYSYLTRADGRAFLPGYWVATLEGTDADGSHVAYSGVVVIGGPRPNMPQAASMMGQTITGSTGAKAVLGR